MSNENKIVKVVIHQSITDPVLIMGAERQLIIALSFSALIVYIAGKDFASFVLALGIWFIGLYFARLMAKVDPQLIQTLIRHLKYHQDFYPATECLNV